MNIIKIFIILLISILPASALSAKLLRLKKSRFREPLSLTFISSSEALISEKEGKFF